MEKNLSQSHFGSEDADQALRTIIASCMAPPSLDELSDLEVESMFDGYHDSPLSEEQLESILRRTKSLIDLESEISSILDEQAAASARPRKFGLPLADSDDSGPMSPPTSPVLGFLGNPPQTWGGFTPTLWSLLALVSGVLTLALVVVLAIRGINVHVEGPRPETASNSQPPTVTPSSVPVARLVRTLDCVWSTDLSTPRVGEHLVTGSELVLESGLAEIDFENGARTVLEGPARLKIVSSSVAVLTRGKIAVTVEVPSARGFAVVTPGMKYTDLGTEFGVLVAQTGEQEVHVFRGKVQAEQGIDTARGRHGAAEKLPSPSGRGAGGEGGLNSSPSPPLVLSAHEAIRVAAPDASGEPAKPIQRIAANEKLFVRVIREPFPLFSTGVGLASGDSDPHWQIVAVSTDPKFKAQQAVVLKIKPTYGYLAGSRETGQWIATTEAAPNMPAACRWKLRTRFDLSGFDPATAQIEGRIAADDFVTELRLNGARVPLPAATRLGLLSVRGTQLRIEKGFVAGVNTVDIVIENGLTSGPNGNAMAFYLQWRGMAQKNAVRGQGNDK